MDSSSVDDVASLRSELNWERERRLHIEALYEHTRQLCQSHLYTMQAQVNVRHYAEEEVTRLRWARGYAEDQARDTLRRLQHLREVLLSVQELALRWEQSLFVINRDGSVSSTSPLPTKTLRQAFVDIHSWASMSQQSC
jgi:hypothetical protein